MAATRMTSSGYMRSSTCQRQVDAATCWLLTTSASLHRLTSTGTPVTTAAAAAVVVDGVQTKWSQSASCQCDRLARKSWECCASVVPKISNRACRVPGQSTSVPASVVPGHILGSWGQLCCPSNVCMHEDGCSDRISAELVVWHLSRMLLLLLSYVEGLKVCCQRQVDAVTCWLLTISGRSHKLTSTRLPLLGWRHSIAVGSYYEGLLALAARFQLTARGFCWSKILLPSFGLGRVRVLNGVTTYLHGLCVSKGHLEMSVKMVHVHAWVFGGSFVQGRPSQGENDTCCIVEISGVGRKSCLKLCIM